MVQTNGTAAGKDYTVPLWIDGKEVTTSQNFDVIGPKTSEVLWKSYGASTKEALEAVEAAQKAFKTWKNTKPQAVRKILLKAADIMEERGEELAMYMEEETGAPEALSIKFNVPGTVEMLRDVAGRTVIQSGHIPITGEPGTGSFVFREPYGVILGIAPWNAPYILGMRAGLFAIATGNTTVLKGSELSPRTFWAIGSVLHEAGLPAGVFNVIYHRPEDAVAVTNTLIEHPAVRKVNFTGSTAVGSIIAAKAGKELKPVLMELGGKASAIVCADANIQNASFQCALGAFVHSGQICMSTERILVHRSILPEFSEALKSAVEIIYPSSDLGPILVAKPAVEKNKNLITDAKSKGAKLIHGDLENITSQDSTYRIRPFIITDVTKDMDIYYTESFGPSVSLIPFDSEEEALEIANDTEYGLSGAIFTENLGTGLRLARQIDTGAVHINQMSVHDEPSLPHGGVKKSGWGRFNAQWGLDEFTKFKTVTYRE